MLRYDDITAEHAEEAGFLWAIRPRRAASSTRGFAALAEHDERIAAHLDGLLLAGDDGWGATLAALEAKPRAEEAFSAVWLAGHEPDRRSAAILAVLAAKPEAWRGAAEALAWLDAERRSTFAERLWQAGGAARAAAIAGPAVLGEGTVERVGAALADADLLVRNAGLQAMGGCGLATLLPRIAKETTRPAAFSRLLLGDLAAAESLRQHVITELADVPPEDPGSAPETWAALDLIARRQPPQTVLAWARATWGETRPAFLVAAAAGDPGAIPWLVTCCRQPAIAHLAGAAIATIAGLDLAADGLAIPGQAGPEPDLHLPMPDAGRIASWWTKTASRLPAGTRHVAGQPVAVSAWRGMLHTGTQSARRGAAYELNGQSAPFPVTAPAPVQRRLLTGAA